MPRTRRPSTLPRRDQPGGAAPVGDNLRVDHALADGCTVPPYYDPMLAKVIAYDQDRPKAIARLIEALKAFEVEGVKTTIPVNLKILEHLQFQAGEMDTSFIAEQLGLE